MGAKSLRFLFLALAVSLNVLLPASGVLAADSKNTGLYEFKGAPDGYLPVGLVVDSHGNVYGVTSAGGNCGSSGFYWQCGMIYELERPTKKGGQWAEHILFNFPIGTDGMAPSSALVFGQDGNLYGTAILGGALGGGTVFELKRPSKEGGAWTIDVLYNFPYLKEGDGSLPSGSLFFAQDGNIYGTTQNGGSTTCYVYGCGTVFKLEPPAMKNGAWKESVIYTFQGNGDGGFPDGNVVADAQGNLYGTTSGNQQNTCVARYECGSIFELTPPAQKGDPWTETTLMLYTTNILPAPELTIDAAGNLYGSTFDDGGWGSVFELSPATSDHQLWTYTTLYKFTDASDGGGPEGGVIFGADGKLYGTTAEGGNLNYCYGGGCGTVFQLTKHGGAWSKRTLWKYSESDGIHPTGDLVWGKGGVLFGTALEGGVQTCQSGFPGCGTVRQFAP